jgi:uncharacterized protein YdeI (YjbR/CyaY-like superfamily)
MPQWRTTEESDIIETYPFCSTTTSDVLLKKVTEVFDIDCFVSESLSEFADSHKDGTEVKLKKAYFCAKHG